MNATSEKTVRQIAVENPSSVRVFESLGIDYCCGGKRSLQEACQRAGMPLNRVAQLLEEADRNAHEPDFEGWKDAPVETLIQEITERHHAYVRAEIPRLQSLFVKVNKHQERYPQLAEIRQIFTALAEELTGHMLKEEQVLFPYIRSMGAVRAEGGAGISSCFGSIRRPVAALMADHDDAGALLERVRELAHNYEPPADACPTLRGLYQGLLEFERDLHRHVHLENNLLFPKAIELESEL